MTWREILLTNYLRAYHYLYSMRKRAFWSREKLESYQLQKLRSVIKYAYDHVPYYKRKLRELEIKPGDIRNRSDLNKVPVIRKNDIKRNVENLISEDFSIKNLAMRSTSGSTGEPLTVYLSASEIEFRKAKHLRANNACGQKAWDRWVTLTGPQHFGKSTRLQRLIALYVPITTSVFNDVSTQIAILERLKPNVLDGYSSALLLLAKEVERLSLKTINPKFIISGAELLDGNSRDYIGNVFGVPVYDQYSSVEFDRMSWQCRRKMGYHIDADALIIQFLDKNGEEVSSGETGEIVVTSLFNYAMPLIRYSIGDVGTPSDETCDCGRNLPLMKMVGGRKDSLLYLPNGQVITPRAFTVALHEFKFYNLIEKFRIIQKKLDVFEFIIELKDDSLNERIFEEELVTHLRTIFKMHDLTFNVRFVEEIPLDKNGKLMAVVSRLRSPV
jgi:phenylacetate-CoA ligase